MISAKAEEKEKQIWDCDSRLYDSWELITFYHQLHHCILHSSSSSSSLRSMSMPHSANTFSIATDYHDDDDDCHCCASESFRFIDDYLSSHMAAAIRGQMTKPQCPSHQEGIRERGRVTLGSYFKEAAIAKTVSTSKQEKKKKGLQGFLRKFGIINSCLGSPLTFIMLYNHKKMAAEI